MAASAPSPHPVSVATAPRTQAVVHYAPRVWAQGFHGAWQRFLALILHRRAGKTTAIINHHQRAAMSDGWERARIRRLQPDLTDAQVETIIHPPGGRHYGHVMPFRTQAKLTVWDQLKWYAATVPGTEYNESELMVRYPTGHKLQLFGADNPDALRGPGFSGLSFDEYSLHPANLFSEVLSKSLADRLGYAIFAGTIRGKDQLYHTWRAFQSRPDCFALWQDVDRSLATEDDATLLLLKHAMTDDQKLIADGLMTQAEYDQEWYLSPEAAIKGAWFATELEAAKAQGRLTKVPHEPLLKVHTAWDLGVDDATAIWLYQTDRMGAIRVIDYYEGRDVGLPHYITWLATRAQERGYVYGSHYGPHDIQVRDFGTGKSRLKAAAELGLVFTVAPNLSFADGINAVRLTLPKCYFDETLCAVGLESLRQYRRMYNARMNEFTGEAVHDKHCVTGDTKVLTPYGPIAISELPPKGEVLTPCGWTAYQNPHMTRADAPLVAVTFSDGLTVRCTPEHLFLTDAGWKFASDLRTDSRIQSCWTPSRNTSMEASIACLRWGGITRAAIRGGDSIAMSGRWLLGLFRQAVTCIIEMLMLGITTCRTWNVYRPLSTCLVTGIVSNLASQTTFLPQRDHKRRRGTDLRPVGCGISDKPDACRFGSDGSGRIGPVNTAAKSCPCWSVVMDILKNIVHKPVRVLRVARVMPLSDRADTWCLTVPDGHWWALANGAITHNSHAADAFRTLAVAHKPPQDERTVDAPETYGWTVRAGGRSDVNLGWLGN